MLIHHDHVPIASKRVVVLGARGFVGRILVDRLCAEGVAVTPISSDQIDLTAHSAEEQLASVLQPDDTVVFLAAITPDKGRNAAAMLANLQMGAHVCAALERCRVGHVVYVSSDAVYPFHSALVRETSSAEPTDLYGSMHLAREIMVKQAVTSPVAVLRPTMIYGAQDTHNSYGPNRFRRMAHKEGQIRLFGLGEETRDHIAVEDVVRLIMLTISRRSAGTLNLATGRSVSFADVAALVAQQFPGTPIEIASAPRQAPITHRAFDVTGIYQSFPEFRFTPLVSGLAAAHRAEFHMHETRIPVDA